MKNKPLLPLLLLVTHPALSNDGALQQCRQVEEILERVRCYDELVDSRYPTNNAEPAEPTEQEITTAPPEPPNAQSLFGKNDAVAKRIVETTLAIEQIEQIEAVVTTVRKSVTKKLTIALDNGQTWRQLDSQRFSLRDGETVIVRKASLGSYLMEKKSGGRGIRVKRSN